MSETLKNPFETMPKSITGGLLPPSRKPVGDMDAIPLSAALPPGIAPEAEVPLSHAPATVPSTPETATTPSGGWNPFKLTRGKAVFLAGLGTLGGVYYALDTLVPKEPVQKALHVQTQPTEPAKPTVTTPKLSEERPLTLLPVPSTTPTFAPLPEPVPPLRTVSADTPPITVAPVIPAIPEIKPLVTPDPLPPVSLTPAPVLPVVVPDKPPTVNFDRVPEVVPPHGRRDSIPLPTPTPTPTPIPIVPAITPTPVPVVPVIKTELPPVVVPDKKDLIPPVTLPVTPDASKPVEFKPLPTPSTSTAVIPIVPVTPTPTPTLVTPTPIPALTPPPTPGVKPVPEFKALPATVTEPKTDYDVDLHRVRSGDNYQSVSEKFYGSPKYAPALRSYNSNAELTQLKEVQVPPLNVIRRMAQSMPEAIDPVVTTGSTTPAPMEVTPTWNPQGGKPKGTADDIRFEKYKVPRTGMTMKDVAKAVYGSEKEWPRVDNRNNIRFRPDEELPVGAELIVPVERIDWR